MAQYVQQFRNAINAAKGAGLFNDDNRFWNFPNACCDDTCDLLAKYLFDSIGIRTQNVHGTYRDNSNENICSHAWLLLDGQTIIDITGDQFANSSLFFNYNIPVYIGNKGCFHALFEVEQRDIREPYIFNKCVDKTQQRLMCLYQKIFKFL